jgi:AAA domain, putative AbiEii toxin, Type IV TA system
MFLKRVQVPDFRVLKHVDITFDPQLEPRVFPLGSQNGGGKSTLLQLIFVLLHCAIDPEKFHLVENLLQGFEVNKRDEHQSLAIVKIWDDAFGDISLEYIYLPSLALQTTWRDNRGKEKIAFKGLLCDQGTILLGPYSDNSGREDPKPILLCQVGTSKASDLCNVLDKIAAKTFLAAPSTQVFQFLPLSTRKKLFSSLQMQQSSNSYITDLEDLQKSIKNLFTYDFLIIDGLTNLFKKARDNDFRDVVQTGQYGNSYHQTLKLVNDSVLVGKKINSLSDLTGVQFHLDSGIEIQPEDLSHGELKRFSIYIWLTSQNLQDAIVLMDEIEIALHPDWQYQIVHDLTKWGPSNQYILATHSYELCQALTPAHVKEISPNLQTV